MSSGKYDKFSESDDKSLEKRLKQLKLPINSVLKIKIEDKHSVLKRKIALQLRGCQWERSLQFKKNDEEITKESRKLFRYYYDSEIFHKSAIAISRCLSRGADIDYRESGIETTLLMLAVDDDNARLVEYLLKQGADPLIKFRQGVGEEGEIASDFASTESSIYWLLKNYELLRATINNDLNTVKKTLKAGADINFQGANGYSALLIAVHLNYIDLVEYLLLKEANILLNLPDGEDIFDLASSEEVCNLLSMVTAYYDNTKDGNNSPTNTHNFFNQGNN